MGYRAKISLQRLCPPNKSARAQVLHGVSLFIYIRARTRVPSELLLNASITTVVLSTEDDVARRTLIIAVP